MLKLQINNKNAHIVDYNMIPSEIKYSDGTKSHIVITSENHKLRNNDIIKLISSSIETRYVVRCNVNVIDSNNVSIHSLGNVLCQIENIEKRYLDYRLLPPQERAGIEENEVDTSVFPNIENKLALVLTLSSEHYFRNKKNYQISEVLGDYYYQEPLERKKRCNGDCVLYNGFSYIANVMEDGRYAIDTNETFMNNATVNLDFMLNGKKYTVTEGIVPITEYGYDELYQLVFFFKDGEEESDKLYNKELDTLYSVYRSTNVTYPDPRFFKETNNGYLSLLEMDSDGAMSYIYKEVGHFHIMFPFGDSFSVEQNRDELLSDNYIEKVKKESINKIVDNEKRQFSPMYYCGEDDFNEDAILSDDLLKPVNKLVFNLHFRKRTNAYGSDGSILKEWITEDELAWNNYTIDSNGDLCPSSQFENVTDLTHFDNNADLLNYLNFSDYDVYYQTNKLKKSFIRLSFYDSPNRATQSLLFYSTIFFDAGELYTKYIKTIQKYGGSGQKPERNTKDIVSKEHINNGVIDDDLRLSARFSCSDKYDMGACSEGFYLYLFPDMINGAETSYVYMKVEFNHAKYGRTIPFTMPTFGDDGTDDGESWMFDGVKYTPLGVNNSATTTYFPVHYLLTSTQEVENTDTEDNETTVNASIDGINMKRLFSDTYIKIGVKYNYKLNQYCWFLPRKEDDLNNSELTFNLFEPRINGFEAVERDIDNVERESDITTDAYGYTVGYIIECINDLPENSNISVTFSVNGFEIANNTLVFGETEVSEGTIKIPYEIDTLNIKATTTGNSSSKIDKYTLEIIDYNKENIWEDGENINCLMYETNEKEQAINISKLLFSFDGQKFIRLNMIVKE